MSTAVANKSEKSFKTMGLMDFRESHRNTDYTEVEGIHKDYQSPNPGPVQDTPGHTMSKSFFNTVRLGAVTTSLGSLFQCSASG